MGGVGKATPSRRGFGWAAMENEKDTTVTAITLGSKYFSYVRSTAPSHKQTLSNPFRNFTNKLRGKIFYKEVFLRLSACVVYSFVFIFVHCLLLCRYDAAWYCRWLYNNGFPLEVIDENINLTVTKFENKSKIFDPSKCPVYFRLHWIGPASLSFADKIVFLVYRYYHAVKVKSNFASKAAFNSIHKDVLPIVNQSLLIYKCNCRYNSTDIGRTSVMFWPVDPAKNAIQGDAPEGGDTF